ncbi:anti-sigma factor family protein [Dethiobacter alkaliphilus]|uniref:Anti-sigma-W factor RsiW n=1 Tax=Dethiobacter alkaliphilus AHT 1 TaxID=555088 RepID=C0GIR5_DETAL|nr:zf-HC2 domain-containing protein [Dethiobacter alkaliphilus]EEG76729.1 putative transmembrane anti-sigma factor [Dethiobacter alkaliphilus AHT 1]
MTCDAVRESMCEYLDGLLDEDEKQAFKAHLDQCGDCREEAEQLRTTMDWMKQAEEVTPPAGLRQNVLAELSGEQKRRSRQSSGVFQFVAAAAVFIMLVAANVLPLQPDMLTADEAPLIVAEDEGRLESFGMAEEEVSSQELGIQGNNMDDDARDAGDMNSQPLLDDTDTATVNWQLILNVLLVPLFVGLVWWAVKKRREALP